MFRRLVVSLLEIGLNANMNETVKEIVRTKKLVTFVLLIFEHIKII